MVGRLKRILSLDLISMPDACSYLFGLLDKKADALQQKNEVQKLDSLL